MFSFLANESAIRFAQEVKHLSLLAIAPSLAWVPPGRLGPNGVASVSNHLHVSSSLWAVSYRLACSGQC